jgi:hypothetical protein
LCIAGKPDSRCMDNAKNRQFIFRVCSA